MSTAPQATTARDRLLLQDVGATVTAGATLAIPVQPQDEEWQGMSARTDTPGSEAGPISDTALIEALPSAVLVVDTDNRFLRVNVAAQQLFEASASQLRRSRLTDLLPFACPLITQIEQVRRSGASINEYGVEFTTARTQAQRLVDVFASPIARDSSNVMVILQERSMAQLMERQLSHVSAARSISGMAAMLAHEIKNPLSGIRGAAQLLQHDLDAEGRSLTQLICTETDRIAGLVNRMEVFGHEGPPARDAVNIHAVLSHVRALAESGFAKHVSFQEIYDPSLPPVPGDRDQLIQVILNLVKNAAEAIASTRSDGRITLATAYRPGVHLSVASRHHRRSLPLMITVTDNGTGVPADLRRHIFEPFVTSKSGGNGLGLALVAKIINDHGGVIECTAASAAQPGQASQPASASASNQGTQFRILLPIASRVAAQAQSPGAQDCIDAQALDSSAGERP